MAAQGPVAETLCKGNYRPDVLGACAKAGYGDGAQKTNHPELLQTPAFYLQKAQYIRNNPVVMGLVTEPDHYAWSSAHPQAPLTTDEA